jgi:colicin import membrane protein
MTEATAADRPPVIETKIAEYSPTAAALADLRQRFANVAFDVTTTKGNADARAARLELVKLRTSLEAKRKELKAPALERSRLIDDEAKRISSEILALETPIDEQIKADEARREREREARAEAERQRVAAIREQIEQIAAVARRAVGKPAADVEAKIKLVVAIAVDDRFAEFQPEAARVHGETLATLRELLAAAQSQEAEAARLAAERAALERERAEQAERDRIERERMAAEAAAQRAQIEREQAEARARQQAEADRLAAERRAEEERAAAARAEQEAREAAARAERERADREAAEARAAADRQAAEARQAEERRIAAERSELARHQMLAEHFQAAVDRVGYERAKAVQDAFGGARAVLLLVETDAYIDALAALQPPAPETPDAAEAAEPAAAEPAATATTEATAPTLEQQLADCRAALEDACSMLDGLIGGMRLGAKVKADQRAAIARLRLRGGLTT